MDGLRKEEERNTQRREGSFVLFGQSRQGKARGSVRQDERHERGKRDHDEGVERAIVERWRGSMHSVHSGSWPAAWKPTWKLTTRPFTSLVTMALQTSNKRGLGEQRWLARICS
jgi:hypothetical protein